MKNVDNSKRFLYKQENVLIHFLQDDTVKVSTFLRKT